MADAPSLAELLIRLTVSLGTVLALAWMAAAVLRRRKGSLGLPGTSGSLAIVERRPLSRSAQVAVVELDGTRYLVGVTDERISLIDRISGNLPGDGRAQVPCAPDETMLGALTSADQRRSGPTDHDLPIMCDLHAMKVPNRLIPGFRRTGSLSASGGSTPGTSLIDALRELTVRRS